MDATASKKRILILGGGFGGVATARYLEGLFRWRPDVEIVLVSRDNFLLMTPLLFEVFSGALDLRSCTFPIRAFLRTTRFVEATVQCIDLDRHVVRLAAAGESKELAYDQLVLALGSKTNRERTPGSEHAFTFKTLADALLLRNHVIERFERADVETDPQRKAQLLTFVVIGGGLVGVELTPIGSALLGFGFLALGSIGRDLEHPFDNSVHDVAMTSICRTIEINLKQYLGEADLPPPIEPVRGVLW